MEFLKLIQHRFLTRMILQAIAKINNNKISKILCDEISIPYIYESFRTINRAKVDRAV